MADQEQSTLLAFQERHRRETLVPSMSTMPTHATMPVRATRPLHLCSIGLRFDLPTTGFNTFCTLRLVMQLWIRRYLYLHTPT